VIIFRSPSRGGASLRRPAFFLGVLDVDIIYVLAVLIVVGVVLYLIQNYLPIDQTIKMLINVVIVLFLLLWLLRFFGVVVGPRHSLLIVPANP
jgi:hypothetical protein